MRAAQSSAERLRMTSSSAACSDSTSLDLGPV